MPLFVFFYFRCSLFFFGFLCFSLFSSSLPLCKRRRQPQFADKNGEFHSNPSAQTPSETTQEFFIQRGGVGIDAIGQCIRNLQKAGLAPHWIFRKHDWTVRLGEPTLSTSFSPLVSEDFWLSTDFPRHRSILHFRASLLRSLGKSRETQSPYLLSGEERVLC